MTNLRKFKPAISVLLLILMVSMIVPFSTFGVASAAEPGSFTQKWRSTAVGVSGESLLTADVLTDAGHPGEEIFHAGGPVAPELWWKSNLS